jgi:hypothetical protein
MRQEKGVCGTKENTLWNRKEKQDQVDSDEEEEDEDEGDTLRYITS